MRRNAIATGVLAEACAERGVDLLVVSTNEVFDGTRPRRPRLRPDRPAQPGQPVRRLQGRRRASGGRGVRRPPRREPRDRPDGLAVRGARARLPEPDPRRRRARAQPPASRSAPSSDEWGTPTYTADVADAIVELLAEDATAGIHHLVNGLFATRADWARDVVGRARHRRRDRGRPGLDLGAPVAPAPLGRPRADAAAVAASRCAPWPDAMADYAPALLRAPAGPRMTGDRGRDAVGAAGRPLRDDRPPRRQPRLVPRAVAGRVVPGRDVRPGQPVDLGRGRPARAPPPPPPGRPVGRRGGPGARRARRRPAGARRRRSGRSSRPASSAPTTGSTSRPASPTASSPSSRSQLIYLVTNEYDGSDELGFAWDDPAVGVPWPTLEATAGRTPDPVRP